MRSIVFILALGLAVTVAALPAHAQTRRVAVIVGANKAPTNRKELRYAHRDAANVGRVLRAVGGFSKSDVHIMLDPSPDAVLRLLDAQLKELASVSEAMLLFYYSGHADDRSLFPNGRTLSLKDLRKRLNNSRVKVRIGIIDACRGGGWTGSKGLSPVDPFDPISKLGLSSEGTALIASSSGLEDAHESEHLLGSFFTHHWNAALRGAGDSNGDGAVTLAEAFDYSNKRTVHDTALYTEEPQHPSFLLDMHGRRDVVLARLALGTSVIEVDQDKGPLRLIHLETGRVILETPTGKRHFRLVVAPGRYLLRSGTAQSTRVIEVDVFRGATSKMEETKMVGINKRASSAKSIAVRNDATTDGASLTSATSELLLGFAYVSTRYRVLRPEQGDCIVPVVSKAASASYLWRAMPNLGTQFGLGLGTSSGGCHRTETGGPVAHLSLGPRVSLPILRGTPRFSWLSTNVLEGFAGLDLRAIVPIPIGSQADALPIQLRASVSAGVLFYPVFVQLGYGMNLAPQTFSVGQPGTALFESYADPRPDISLAIGVRVARDLF